MLAAAIGYSVQFAICRNRTSQRPLCARSGRSEHARGESPNDQSGL